MGYYTTSKKEGNDGPVSLHWLIWKNPYMPKLQELANWFETY